MARPVPAPKLELARKRGRMGDAREQQRDVGRADVGPDRAGRLRALEDERDPAEHALLGREQLLAGRDAAAERVEEAAVGDLQRHRLLEEAPEPGLGLGLEAALAEVEHGAHAVEQELGHERVLRREAPEHGRVADARTARDLVHPGIEAALGEHLRRRVEDAAAVAEGVGPESRLDGHQATGTAAGSASIASTCRRRRIATIAPAPASISPAPAMNAAL